MLEMPPIMHIFVEARANIARNSKGGAMFFHLTSSHSSRTRRHEAPRSKLGMRMTRTRTVRYVVCTPVLGLTSLAKFFIFSVK
ncbi:hypothetical protein BOTBODRAFT_30996 [Botryobasidium botryosum FD-172 SS1]|uniref:Uncharacterized protein n=1 Tax=Botryobasidium botryosum (strain FD-172 SS1) TaxID=930990 RepID=A0A067ML68_BOTB1|nr:hypothetical protein BOTBODRAFT_30996 [Botryobasidium botryosum FD-172 SS1]